MNKEFEYLKNTRENIIKIIAPLTIDQLNTIPSGFRNNIAWNVGHLIVSQQNLLYSLSKVEPICPQEFIIKYKRGTFPENPIFESGKLELIQYLEQLPDKVRKDYDSGKFTTYIPFKTHYGTQLNSIEDAIIFNNIHEALHLGYIMAMVKLV